MDPPSRSDLLFENITFASISFHRKLKLFMHFLLHSTCNDKTGLVPFYVENAKFK